VKGRNAEPFPNRTPRKLSFLNGLSTLTDTLAEQLDVDLRFGHALQRIEQVNGGWSLELMSATGTEIEEHPAVLLTVPAYKLSSVPLVSRARAKFDFLEQIRYAPVSSLVLGFKRDQVEHPLDGFGFLVPEVEKFSILGAIFSSSLFPNRAPKGHVCISCYLGGFRSPETAFRLKEEQVTLAVADLNRALGIKDRPVFTHNVVFPKAIPQYELGYSKIAAQIEALEQNCPGLHLGGNYYRGVSLGDSILNGLAYGEQLAREHSPVLNFEHHLAAA
jgi:oxygen-dependent protoporphyrinogen oxidase